MSFDPGPGWVEVPRPVAAAAREAISWRGPHDASGYPRSRTWVPAQHQEMPESLSPQGDIPEPEIEQEDG